MRWRSVLVSLALLLSMLACAPRFLKPPQVVSMPPPSRAVEDIFAAFDQRWRMLEEIRVLARVTVTSGQGRFSTRQTFLWHRPDLLRLDSIALFGHLIMSLVADAAQVSIYYPPQGTFFQGPSTAENLAQFTGVPLTPEDFGHLLIGYIRPGPGAPKTTIHAQVDAGSYLLRFLNPRGDLLQDVWVAPEHWLPARVVRYAVVNLPVIDILYSDFRPIADDVALPFHLTIWLLRAGTEIRIQVLTADLNPGLPRSLFQLSPPEGIPVVPLE